MNRPSAADLVRWWPPPPASAHERVVALLCAMDGPDALEVPLGGHHQRLLAVHRACVGADLEAVVTCRHCGAESEFPVPAAQVLELASPRPDARVLLETAEGPAEYRLPTVADLEATAGLTYGDAVRAIAERTRIDGHEAPAPDDAALDRLAAAWEVADPAATVTVDLDCAGCATGLTATVDPAEFVARDLDRLVDRLLGEVHILAVAYGWAEDVVLALPAPRRRRYLELVGATAPDARRLTSVTS